jgi:hypothetical protein
VQRKREHKQAKRGGGRVAAGGVGKNKKQAAKGAKAAKGGKKPSKM